MPSLVREMAAWNVYGSPEGKFCNVFTDYDASYRDSLLVPYDPNSCTIKEIAALPHLSNSMRFRDAADAGAPNPFCRIPFSEVLTEMTYLDL